MKTKSSLRLPFFNLPVLICVALFWTLAICAYASTITVININDSGPGSLRQALVDANDGDMIDFAVTGTIALTNGGLVVDKSFTISGPGPTQLTVSGYVTLNAGFRVFYVTPNHTVTIEGLTISRGRGGISNDQATLTVNNCAVIYNSANRGDDGGGINNRSGTLTIINSTVRGNSADGGGGGINSYDGALMITGSTIADNFALFGGGGVSSGSGTIEITDSTISGNTAGGGDDYIPGSGGGIFAGAGTISNSTITGNTAWGDDFKGPGLGGGVYSWGTVATTGTVLSYNLATEGDNIYGAISSLGYNLCSDVCGLSGPGDLNNTDPLLGPLTDNGGPTFTHALLPPSPAINTGDPSFTPPPSYDQRGSPFVRVFNGRIDIGSFEAQPPRRPSPTSRPRPTPPPRPTPR